MKTVYKYLVSLREDLWHDIPVGARFVHVDRDTREEALAVWAEVDPNAPREKVQFAAHGTGGDVPDFKTYVGSVKVGAYMWHVYMEKRP